MLMLFFACGASAPERSTAELVLGPAFLSLAGVRLLFPWCKSNGEKTSWMPFHLAVLLFATCCDFMLIILGH